MIGNAWKASVGREKKEDRNANDFSFVVSETAFEQDFSLPLASKELFFGLWKGAGGLRVRMPGV